MQIRNVFKAIIFTAIVGLYANPAFSDVSDIIVKDAQPYSFNSCVDVSDNEIIGIQGVYSDGTPSAKTLSSGSKPAASISITDFNAVDGKQSTGSFTVTAGNNTSAALSGQYITVRGRRFTEGVDWALGTTSTITAKNIETALNLHSEYTAQASSNVITATATAIGIAANLWTLTSSTPSSISTVTWRGGQEAGYININGTTLTEGTDFNAETSTAITAENIETAINANSTLSAVFTATHPHTTGFVYTTATVNSAQGNYYISASSNGITINNFTYGSSSEISVSGDTFAETSHGFTTGLKVLFSTTSPNVAPGGLRDSVTYYAIRLTDNSFSVATTSTTAVAGTAIDITSLPDIAGSTYTFTPAPLVVGLAGFHWQGSNDGTNKDSLNVSSVTYTASGNTIWDMGSYPYKYLCVDFVAPTSGGIDFTAIMNGRR